MLIYFFTGSTVKNGSSHLSNVAEISGDLSDVQALTAARSSSVLKGLPRSSERGEQEIPAIAHRGLVGRKAPKSVHPSDQLLLLSVTTAPHADFRTVSLRGVHRPDQSLGLSCLPFSDA